MHVPFADAKKPVGAECDLPEMNTRQTGYFPRLRRFSGFLYTVARRVMASEFAEYLAPHMAVVLAAFAYYHVSLCHFSPVGTRFVKSTGLSLAHNFRCSCHMLYTPEDAILPVIEIGLCHIMPVLLPLLGVVWKVMGYVLSSLTTVCTRSGVCQLAFGLVLACTGFVGFASLLPNDAMISGIIITALAMFFLPIVTMVAVYTVTKTLLQREEDVRSMISKAVIYLTVGTMVIAGLDYVSIYLQFHAISAVPIVEYFREKK
jgi:hypothetical protein